jgi:hypothetical protein
MSPDQFDEFLSKSLQNSEIEFNHPISEIEQLIIEKMARNQAHKKKRQRRILNIAVLVVALLAFSGTILFPGPLYAFKEQLIQTIIKFGNNININFTDSSPRPHLPDKLEAEIAAIQPGVPFEILVPRYLPPGFEFVGVEKSPYDEQCKIIMYFQAEDAALMLTQTEIGDNFALSVNINAQQGKAEKIQVGGYEGNIITFNDGSVSLTWITDGHILCELSGNLNAEQAIEIAVSM